METLPNELIIEIFNYILKITDKRHFLRTCILYNKLTKDLMCNFESNYKIPYFPKLKYSVEKFTLELCHDGYFELIPERYINSDNKHLVRCLSSYNNLSLLQLAKEKGCKISKITKHHYDEYGIDIDNYNNYIYDAQTVVLVARNGHLAILKFLINNDCEWNNSTTCKIAVENNHLDILKYLYEDCYKLDKTLYDIALTKGHIEIVKWLEEIDCDIEYTHIPNID